MTEPTAHVPLPDVTFEDGTPVSAAFGDVYFSKHGGIAETEHVFLRGNGLPEAWAGRADFTIGELGFGTGLNFLVAWRSFMRTADAGAYLHYIAIEKFPLTLEMLQAALALQPELADEAAALIAAYPLRLPGIHRIYLPRATLTLCYGDAADILPQLDACIDAWFLDGFAPAKNPAMWDDTILTQIGRLSAPDARVATFTAAGAVKRGLMAQGFAMEKVAGYGHKRDMLVGQRTLIPPPIGGRLGGGHEDTPSVITPPPQPSPYGGGGTQRSAPSSTLILGAGIAGCTLARALAERGGAVTILERAAIASGASGNPAAVLFPQLPKRCTAAAAWYFTAYDFMLRQLARWQLNGLHFAHATPGMLRLPRHAEEEMQLRSLNETLGLDPAITHWLERDAASAHAGIHLTTGGAWFPQGSWISPPELCRALLAHPLITLHEQTEVEALTLTRDGWTAQTKTGAQFSAEHCCVTTAYEAAHLLPEYNLKLHAVAGQVSLVDVAHATAPLKTILCHKGYVIPLGNHYLIGATYNHDDHSGNVTTENHQRNRAEVESFLPGWLRGEAVAGRTSFRATTPDRLPYVGQLTEGLFISTGHGSRGMLSAPLAAEVIASLILGEQVPLTSALRKAVDPSRFNH